MRSIVQAMAWEFWRKMQGRLILHLAVIGLGADLVLAVLAVLWVAAGFSWNQRLLLDLTNVVQSFLPSLLWSEMILFCYAVVQCQCEGTAERRGFPRRLYPLPAPTWALVAQRMLIASAAVALAHIAIFAPFNYLIGVEVVPVLAPALFLAGAAAIAQAVAWSLTGFPRIRRAALFVPAFALLALWPDILRAQGRFDPTTGTWLSPPLAQWLLIAALTPVAYLVALAGVARDRRGGSLGMPAAREWIERVRDLMPSRSKAFASPEGAQFWYEWCRCGGWGSVVGLILGSLFLTMLLLGTEDEPVASRI
ncbi:MAG TPA: hypothetical protein VM492_07750, partial [Sumerlaeia bacterium]|nr:hypothetical protein [Sumerlaeia bacterium]